MTAVPPPRIGGFDFRILGVIEVVHSAGVVRPTAPKQRSLLAALLLNANRVLTLERLVDVLWEADPPRSAIANVRTYAMSVRRLLRDSDAPEGMRLVTSQEGYLLRLGADELDATRFARLAERGRSALADRDVLGAVSHLGQALQVWRHDHAGVGIPRWGPLMQWLTALDEQRLRTIDDYLDARLTVGIDAELVGEIRRSVIEDPLRERRWAQLMLASYRSGDMAGALRCYTQARAALDQGLGVDPGPELQRLHRGILNRDIALRAEAVAWQPAESSARTAVEIRPKALPSAPAPASSPAPAPPARSVPASVAGPAPSLASVPASASVPGSASVPDSVPAPVSGSVSGGPVHRIPRQMPPRSTCFVGRGAELATIGSAFDGHALADGPPVAVIFGPVGTGKSALAVWAASMLAPMFPDGQLYLDLPAPAGEPGNRADGLVETLLRGIEGCAAELPHGASARCGRLRSLLADQRILLVLDDAAGAADLRPLLPATSSSGVIVTSRRPLTTLDATVSMRLGPLEPDEAVAMLGKLVGADRVATAPAAAADVARLCGHLPLAIRIAAARLLGRQEWSLSHFAARLARGPRPLDELEVDDLSLRDRLLRTFRELCPLAAAAFVVFGRLKVVHSTPHIHAEALRVPVTAAAAALDELVDAQLVEAVPPRQYRMLEFPARLATEMGPPWYGKENDDWRCRHLDGRWHDSVDGDVLRRAVPPTLA